MVLVDTSTLLHELDNGFLNRPKNGDYVGRARYTEMEIRSARFFIDFIKKGGRFYVTEGVFNEYSPNLRPYKERVRKSGRLSGHQLRFERTLGEFRKERNNLRDLLADGGMVLSLSYSEKEARDLLLKEYFPLSRKFGLSPANEDFFFSGMALSGRDSVCMVSNDIGMLKLFEHVRQKEGLNRRKINFFVRRGFNEYFCS